MVKLTEMMVAAVLSVAMVGCHRGVKNHPFTPEAVARYKERVDDGDAEAQYLYKIAFPQDRVIEPKSRSRI